MTGEEREKMKSGSLVSIIIPVFNVRQYFAEAMNSVLQQTYEDLEVILIDDGSTDGSGKLCDEYAMKDSRVTVIHQENKGVSAARNAGLDLMKGDYVAFLDPDDAFDPDFIEEMTDALIRENADIAVCGYTTLRTTGRLVRKGGEAMEPKAVRGLYDRNEALRALAGGLIDTHVWNKLFRRELWENFWFPEGRVYEDVYACYKTFSLSESVFVTGRPLYLYRKRPGSVTKTPSWQNICDRSLAFSYIDSFITENTPEVFGEGQLNKCRERHLNLMTMLYVQCSGKDKKGDPVSSQLREKIIETAQKIGTENFSTRTRAAYGMLCSHPGLLRAAYPVYLKFRYLSRFLRGKR